MSEYEYWRPFVEANLPKLKEGEEWLEVEGLPNGAIARIPSQLNKALLVVALLPEPHGDRRSATPSQEFLPGTRVLGTASFLTANGLVLTAAHVLPEQFLHEQRLACIYFTPEAGHYTLPLRQLACDRKADVAIAEALLPCDENRELTIPALAYLPVAREPETRLLKESIVLTAGYPQTEYRGHEGVVHLAPRIYFGREKVIAYDGYSVPVRDAYEGRMVLEGSFFRMQLHAHGGMSGSPVIAGSPSGEHNHFDGQVIGVVSCISDAEKEPEFVHCYAACVSQIMDLPFETEKGEFTMRRMFEQGGWWQ